MNQNIRKIAGIGLVSIVLVLALAVVVSAAPLGQTRLGYANGDDWEPAIAADRFGHVYVLWPHYNHCDGCPKNTATLQVSNDRGQTWSAPRILTPNNLGTEQVDAQIVVDPIDGKTVYAAWLQNRKSDVLVTKSIDFGQTWSTPVIANRTNAGADKPILAVRGQNVYVGFGHVQKIWVAASHDGGQTFTSNPVRQNSEFGWSLSSAAAIDSHGNVYFSWAGYEQSGKGAVNLYISKSKDGGVTWTSSLVDVSSAPSDCSAYQCGWVFLGAQIVITVDKKNDMLYALWNAGTVDQGPERIYLARSTDGGVHWSKRQDVSLAAMGTNHAFPAIVSGDAGNVRIAWMDARNAPMWNVYYRSSNNGGATWSSETTLSNYVPGYAYINRSGFAFPYGDYFEMDVDDRGATQVVWGEGPNFTGPGNIWYTRMPR